MARRSAILIPAYNAEHCLPNLLGDIKAQTLPFDEVWLYDDASQDQTAQIAKDFGAKVIRTEVNTGPSVARNELLKATEAEWVHFHDADDRMVADFHEKMASLAVSDQSFYFSGWENRLVSTDELLGSGDLTAANQAKDFIEFALAHQFPMIVGYYHRAAAVEVGGFDERFRGGEDWHFHVKLALHGLQFFAIPDKLATICRYGNSSFTERAPLKYLQHHLQACLDIMQRELTPIYQRVLAQTILNLCWRLYLSGDMASVKMGISKAKALGLKEMPTRSSLLAWFSYLFGILPGFRLRDKMHHWLGKAVS
jgi:glycosyltransferase involved in cell wall biosynthesis